MSFQAEPASQQPQAYINLATMSAVPLAKLGALLLRTLTKPIAKRLGERVKESEFFRQTFIKFEHNNDKISWKHAKFLTKIFYQKFVKR